MLKLSIHLVSLCGLLALAAAPPAAADTDYGPLKRVGVQAGNALVEGRQVTVGVRVKRRVRVTITALSGDRRFAFVKATLRRGRYRFSGPLRGLPAAQVRLRITAVDLRTKRRGRSTRRARPAPRAPQAPTRVDVDSLSMPENVAAGAAVGSLAAIDPTAGDTHAFALVGGDDGAFRLDGSTLRTTRSLDFEARSRYDLRVRVTDAAGGGAERTVVVHVVDVDDPPVVALASAPARWVEGDAPALVDAGLTVADQDDAVLDGATVRLAGGVAGGDELTFAPRGGISGAYDRTAGRLDLSGAASVADYQVVLRSVAYRHAGDDPPASRLVEVGVRSRGATSGAATRTIEVTAVNDAPALEVNDAAQLMSDEPHLVDPFLTVRDADGPLSGATVAIASGRQSGDRLELAEGSPVGATYDAATGVLTFSAAAPASDYQEALRRVELVPDPATGGGGARRIDFVVTDAGGATAADSRNFAAP